MRELFPEYVGFSEAESKVLWKEATIVFDTNVLLGIHSWPEDKSKWLIGELKRKPLHRVWIPHQVALEFTRNRTVRLNERIKTIDRIKSELAKKVKLAKESFIQTLKSNRIEVDESNFPDTESLLSAWIEPYMDALEEEKSKLSPRLEIDRDNIFSEFEELFRGKIGQPLQYDEELEIYRQGQERYAQKIPPGYMDAEEKSEPWRKYGDLTLWTQIIQHASTDEFKAVILVTNDAKEDWIGEDGRANPLLKQEFSRKTGGKRFLLLNLDDFIKEAVSHKTIRDTKQIREAAEEAQKDVADAIKLHSSAYAQILENAQNTQWLSTLDALRSLQSPTYSALQEGIRRSLDTSTIIPKAIQENNERQQKLMEILKQVQERNEQMLRLYNLSLGKPKEG